MYSRVGLYSSGYGTYLSTLNLVFEHAGIDIVFAMEDQMDVNKERNAGMMKIAGTIMNKLIHGRNAVQLLGKNLL